MKRGVYTVLLIIGLSVCVINSYSQAINDHIFPAKASAKPFIDFDSKGFVINGKRTFLASGGIDYARVPHQLWRDRLLRLKRAGFNCVEFYTFWNFHEPQEGKFDFTGDRDLNAFLSLIKSLNMYAIARVGPYACAEWDMGGYPIWLKFKDGVRVREDNKEFEKYVDRFFDHLLPIVFNQQISKGGPVIMVQLENEHNNGWGTVTPDNYFKRLQSKALNLGLDVPYFFSGLHHASDPAGEGTLDDSKRPNPWFSTEFWSVWYSQYGAKPDDAAIYSRRTWKIIAHGGSGYNYYMAYGGSNFGYTNNDEDAASYDYGAAIGQTGDLRPIYYAFKRAATFARSFEVILENCSDASASYQNVTADKGITVTARSSNAGDVIFLDNVGKDSLKTNVKADSSIVATNITVAPGEIYPLVHNFQINSFVKLDWALTRIYGLVKQGNTTTILVEAASDNPVSLYFKTNGSLNVIKGAQGFKLTAGGIKLVTTKQQADEVGEYSFEISGQRIRVLIQNEQGTDKTWITEIPGSTVIISGASYIGKVEVQNKQLFAEAQYPLTSQKDGMIRLYNEKECALLNSVYQESTNFISTISLSEWQYKNASIYASAAYNDKNWFSSLNPLQMGADGNLTADAWYRTRLNIPVSGKYTMQVDGGDRATAFIDGKRIVSWKVRDGEVTLDIKKGKHSLAVFTAHDGRDKLAAYVGPITDVDKKGLSGQVQLKKGGPYISTTTNWYFARAENAADVKNAIPAFDTTRWKKYKIGDDAFNKQAGFGWFQTTIPVDKQNTSKLMINFRSVDENATVFINGKQVARHEGWNSPFAVEVNDTEVLKKPITLSVFIENYSNEGGIDQPVKINSIGNSTMLTGWKMFSGPGNPDAATGWDKLAGKITFSGPQFFRSQFTLPSPKGKHLIWRVRTDGLSYGSVWVNGHNLGRYPEKTGNIGMYIPECWLKTGINQLVVYDEDGNRPDKVTIQLEKEASSVTYTLQGTTIN
ncbi:beta-galactosidase [Mucilaginibacter sp. SP1R1]|uniref:beta-galactosidase n=1 Tax=Mucilaginibacter sp. SP1R1 TaxID=2723091 RepID=UPI00161E0BDF|nr:beta-galactosidase [Mucilaginibacter sp. SP1R1]MBB6149027.1 beta-galactosidase [Mucilaginibacter sp. SP1R1]